MTMNNGQDLLAVAMIVGAIVYLAYLLWCRLTKRSACDRCHDCPARPETKAPQHDPHRVTIQTSTRNTGSK